MSQFTQGHALLIGVGADLPNTVDDALGLSAIFKDTQRCAYPPTQVTTLTSQGATRDHILTALEALKSVPSDTTVVVYFSGHGYQVTTPIGPAYYLMPYGYDAKTLYKTAVSGQELTTALKAIPAKKLLLLLDCCHAGGLDPTKAVGMELTKHPLPPEATTLLAQGSGRAIIASSTADELSYAGKPYSAFTLALIEALAGEGASQKDGYVRLADLALYTGRKVPQRTADRQHPILNFQQADNFVVAYYAGGDTVPKGVPFTAVPEIESEPGAFNRQSPSYSAQLQGDGTIVQGNDNTVVGPRGVNVGGSVGGNIFTGDGNIIYPPTPASSATIETELAVWKNKLVRYFSKNELKGLCFDLGVPHDDLQGETRTELAQSILIYAQSRNKLAYLRRLCQAERPHVEWT